jgi:hypothetical protein
VALKQSEQLPMLRGSVVRAGRETKGRRGKDVTRSFAMFRSAPPRTLGSQAVVAHS